MVGLDVGDPGEFALQSRALAGVLELDRQAPRLEQAVGDIGGEAGAAGLEVEPGGGEVGIGLMGGDEPAAEEVQFPADVEIAAVGVGEALVNEGDGMAAEIDAAPRQRRGVSARGRALNGALGIEWVRRLGADGLGLVQASEGAAGVRGVDQGLVDQAFQLGIAVETPPPVE